MTVTRTPDEAVEALMASCLPCELAAQRAEVELNPSEDPDNWHPWEGALTYEGQMTGDGRYIEPNALRWDTLPIPLRWVESDSGAHQGARVVGKINEIERRDDGAIYAKGVFDLGSEVGREAARQVKLGLTPGVSIDMDDVSFEVRVAAETQIDGDPNDIDENGRVKQLAMKSDDEVMITNSGRIRAATLIAIPAFEPTRLVAAGGALNFAYNAAGQLRVPKGNGEFSGRWVDMPGTTLRHFDFDSRTPQLQAYWIAARSGHSSRAREAEALGTTAEELVSKATELDKVRKEAYEALDSMDLADHSSVQSAVAKAKTAIDASVDFQNTLKQDAAGVADSAKQSLDDFAALDLYSDPEFDPKNPEIRAQFANWVEKAGGLPKYIKRIAKHLKEKGMTESHAIATAVNVVKKMCATGDVNFPGKQEVNVGSQAEACAAVAEWEAKKAKSRVDGLLTFAEDQKLDYLTAAAGMVDVSKQARVPKGNGDLSGRWVDMPGKIVDDLLDNDDVFATITPGGQQRLNSIADRTKTHDPFDTTASTWDSRAESLESVAKGEKDPAKSKIIEAAQALHDYAGIDWYSDAENPPELRAAGGMDLVDKQARVPQGNGVLSGRWIDMPGTVMESLSDVYEVRATGDTGNYPSVDAVDLDRGKARQLVDSAQLEISSATDLPEGDLEGNKHLTTAADQLDEAAGLVPDDPDTPAVKEASQSLRDFASVDWESDPDSGNPFDTPVDPNSNETKDFIESFPEAGTADELDTEARLKRRRREMEGAPTGQDDASIVDDIAEQAKKMLAGEDHDLTPEQQDQIKAVQDDLLDMVAEDSRTELQQIIGRWGVPKTSHELAGLLTDLHLWLLELLDKLGLTDSDAGATQINPGIGGTDSPSVLLHPGTTIHDLVHAAHTLAEVIQALVSSAFPTQPPPEWFSDPGLTGPTPLKVSADGRVFGHLAVWGTCHTAYPNQCVTPPSSRSAYSYFKTGSVVLSNGTEVPTGVITMDTLHAGKNLSGPSTLAHYEHTGRAVADVTAGEDAFGIWVSGALRPNVTDEQARVLRASPLSGDWRNIGGTLELVAALAVNVPGFPIPRPKGLVAGGKMQSLVASGILLAPPEDEKVETVAEVDDNQATLFSQYLPVLRKIAEQELEREAAEAATKVELANLARRVGV